MQVSYVEKYNHRFKIENICSNMLRTPEVNHLHSICYGVYETNLNIYNRILKCAIFYAIIFHLAKSYKN